MPVNLSGGQFKRAPAGYYLCRFTGLKQMPGVDMKGEPIERCIWEFVGEPHPPSADTEVGSFDLSIWVNNTFGPGSNQRKLVARMGGTSKRDAMGGLEAVTVEIDPLDPRLAALAESDFADWEGHLFLLRQTEGKNKNGEPTAWCDIDSIWRAEGEEALLPPLQPSLGTRVEESADADPFAEE